MSKLKDRCDRFSRSMGRADLIKFRLNDAGWGSSSSSQRRTACFATVCTAFLNSSNESLPSPSWGSAVN